MYVNSQLHAPAALPPGMDPGTHRIGGWVCSRAGLGVLEERMHLILSGIETFFSLQSVSCLIYRLFSSAVSYGTTNKMIGKPRSKSDY